ncbi:hypothetical protein [Pleomorphovibrio marinus]|uniref:hypothetical protein n=1 Tax=Pleomorphovibrio marinus TaxID=2164132 RepID=UPI000E0A7918|nr:hypothetical protein [Pleomorphovibrio marinus]
MINNFTKTLKVFIYFSIAFLISVSCSSPNSQTEVSESTRESYGLEILDSMVVDFIGVMAWSHISPDGDNFLAIDQQKSNVLLIGKDGEIRATLHKTGDQPDAIGQNLSARPQFRNNAEIALLGSKGLFIFGFDGNLKKSIKPSFDPFSSFFIQNTDQFQFMDENHAVAVYGARNPEGSGFYTEASGTKLESIDVENGTFTGILPYPFSSRYNSSETFPITNSTPVFRASEKGIYLAFKNEAKIFHYDWENTENPKDEIHLKIEPFHLMKGKDPKSVDKKAIHIDVRDFSYGSINNIYLAGDELLVSYTHGLSDEEFDQVTEGISGFQESLRLIEENNRSKLAVLLSDGLPIPIETPDVFGTLEFVDKEGNLWFSPNKNEVERDYEVLYKSTIK